MALYSRFDKAGIPWVVVTEPLDWGAGSDIDRLITVPAGWDMILTGVSLVCTETFAGAANTALNIGTAAGGTQYAAIALDAAGGDAFTAADMWGCVFNEGALKSSAVMMAHGAPGNSVTSVTALSAKSGAAVYVSAQGATGTLTAGIAAVTLSTILIPLV